MSLEIKRKETLRKAVRRIGRKRAKKAESALRHCETMEAIHKVRKEVKQLRALLRLARFGIKRRPCQRLMSKLKRAAEGLAASRNAFVMTAALAGLKSHYKRELSERPFPHVSSRLSEECRAGQKTLSREFRSSRRLFKSIRRDFDSLSIKSSGWSVIGDGLRRTYRDGRRAWRSASATLKPEDFHEWRKKAKELLYQVGLLCRIWPEQMNAVNAELRQLGDYLGDAHDLFLLADSETARKFADQFAEETQVLKGLARKRREELQMQALTLGEKLYAEKPTMFCKRLKLYWKRWRRRTEGLRPVH